MNTKCSRDISFAWFKSVAKHKDVETTVYFSVMVKVLELFHAKYYENNKLVILQ
jgi:hypothetical protein